MGADPATETIVRVVAGALHDVDHGWNCGHHGVMEETVRRRYERMARAAAPLLLAHARRQALSEAYWRIREHASGYRGADAFRAAMDRRHESNDARRIAAVHEFFARGIESGAVDVAEVLGLAENEEPELASGEPA